MNKILLSKLEEITLEEKEILEGHSINPKNYTNHYEFIIQGEKMLGPDYCIDSRVHTRFIDFPEHKHDYIEMMYVIQGSITHVIDNREITLHKGEIILLNQHTWHSIKKCDKDDLAINFMILPSFFNIVYEMIGYDNIIATFLIDILRKSDNKGQYLIFNVSNVFQIQNLMENLIQSLYDQENNFKENQITMGLIFLYMIRNLESIEKGSSQQLEDILVQAALDYINIHYSNATLHEISIALNQTDYNLSKLIKFKTGKTFKELLQSRRFYKAEELLLHTTLSIDDIISSVCYESHSYFFRRFKEKYGVTPKKYRQSK